MLEPSPHVAHQRPAVGRSICLWSNGITDYCKKKNRLTLHRGTRCHILCSVSALDPQSQQSPPAGNAMPQACYHTHARTQLWHADCILPAGSRLSFPSRCRLVLVLIAPCYMSTVSIHTIVRSSCPTIVMPWLLLLCVSKRWQTCSQGLLCMTTSNCCYTKELWYKYIRAINQP